jgi:quaternary ammonium compound-resistance protein SugE
LAWAALTIAGLLEVAWASLMKRSFGADHVITAAMLIALAGSMILLRYAMQSLPVGTAYAVWTGIGAVGAAAMGVVFYGEPASLMRIGSIGLIVAGIAGLKLAG